MVANLFLPKTYSSDCTKRQQTKKHFQQPAKSSLKGSEQFSYKVDIANFNSDGFHQITFAWHSLKHLSPQSSALAVIIFTSLTVSHYGEKLWTKWQIVIAEVKIKQHEKFRLYTERTFGQIENLFKQFYRFNTSWKPQSYGNFMS